ncbi:hypothetical protein Tco_0649190, partial [Tanacetum coccineum]
VAAGGVDGVAGGCGGVTRVTRRRWWCGGCSGDGAVVGMVAVMLTVVWQRRGDGREMVRRWREGGYGGCCGEGGDGEMVTMASGGA